MARSTRTDWAKRVQRWKDSGLTAREFAAEAGLNAGTLQYWASKLRRESRRQQSEEPDSASTALTFVELSHQPAATEPLAKKAVPFELISGKLVVRIPPQFDAEALERLLAVMERRV